MRYRVGICMYKKLMKICWRDAEGKVRENQLFRECLAESEGKSVKDATPSVCGIPGIWGRSQALLIMRHSSNTSWYCLLDGKRLSNRSYVSQSPPKCANTPFVVVSASFKLIDSHVLLPSPIQFARPTHPFMTPTHTRVSLSHMLTAHIASSTRTQWIPKESNMGGEWVNIQKHVLYRNTDCSLQHGIIMWFISAKAKILFLKFYL